MRRIDRQARLSRRELLGLLGAGAGFAAASAVGGDLRVAAASLQAEARTGITSQALEARRNYMMSWPQYAREGAQRAELKSQAMNHAAVMAEVRQLLDWAWRAFPHAHGPADEGMDWDHDLQVNAEAGGWQAVTLTVVHPGTDTPVAMTGAGW